MEPEPEPSLSKVGTRIGTNFSKVGTGTVTFKKSEPELEPEQ
jgi:hypothetical protein